MYGQWFLQMSQNNSTHNGLYFQIQRVQTIKQKSNKVGFIKIKILFSLINTVDKTKKKNSYRLRENFWNKNYV